MGRPKLCVIFRVKEKASSCLASLTQRNKYNVTHGQLIARLFEL